MKNSHIERIFALLKILLKKRTSCTMRELSESLADYGIEAPSDRTLFRDIELLESFGYTIRRQRGEGYLLENREAINAEVFSDEMIQALQMSRSAFSYFEGTHLWNTINETIDLVTGSKGKHLENSRFMELQSNFSVHLGPRRNFTDIRDTVDEIVNAVNGRFALNCTYKKSGSIEKIYLLYPYRIILHRDTLYLLALNSGNEELRLFQISRMKSAEQTAENFVVDKALLRSYEEMQRHSFGISTAGELVELVVVFSKDVADAISERRWHDSQDIKVLDSGDIEMNLKILANGELYTWLRGWGKKIISISPESVESAVYER